MKDSASQGIASQAQLRMSYVRWALVTAPSILFLGFLSGRVANSGYGNLWFAALKKPDIMPPGWAFGAAWSALYLLLGLALAVILHARGAKGRGIAITLFLVQLVGNFCWSPLFFRQHMMTEALWLLIAILLVSIITTWLFARIRPLAAAMMVPYLLWLCFAGALNYQIDRLNPDVSTQVVPALKTRI